MANDSDREMRADLIQYFIEHTIHIQHWQRIMVFRKASKGLLHQYCYKMSSDSDGRLPWNKCNQENGCKDCEEILWKLTSLSCNDSPKNDNGYLYKLGLSEILDPKILPSIDDRDIAGYQDYVLFFEFPAATIFPKTSFNKDDVKKLGEHYISRLTPVFDRLLLKRRVLQHSTKAAVSAIISRNHSHHIGSHVTPRTSSEQIKERLEALTGNAYYDIPSDHLTVIGLLKDRLDRYIQKKAEFTAEVATDPLLSTRSVLLFNDVLLGFIENTLLMDNIGANEDVRYTKSGDSGISIHFFFDDNEIVAQYGDRDPKCKTRYTSLNYPYIGCEANTEHLAMQRIVKFGTQKDEDGKGFDPKIALPGPVGEYAIYSFLENFIRNTIKHNRETLQSPAAANKHLDVYLRIRDLDDEFYTLEIWDTITEPAKKAALEKYVNRSVVEADGKLKKGGWGIAEMKIMATLLKGSDDFLYMSGNIEVVSIQFEDKECLGYSLRVMKAKDLALISQRVLEDRYDTLKKKGIWCFPSIKSFDEHINRTDMPFSSDFVAIDEPGNDDISIEKIAAQAAKLSFRVLIHQNTVKRDVEGAFPGCHLATEKYFKDLENLKLAHEAIIERTWEEWTGRFCGETKPDDVTIGLCLEQALSESPATEWKSLADRMSEADGYKAKDIALTLIYPANNTLNATHDYRSKVALYDRHGQGQVYFSNQAFNPDSVLFYEAFDKNSPDFAHLFSPPKSKITYYELLESALLKILILDERVAEFANKSLTLKHPQYLFNTSGTSRLAVAKRAGIYICTHVQTDSCDPVALHKSVEHVAARINAQISLSDGSLSVLDASARDKKISFDAVVIHQGIMDGILKDLIGRPGGQTAFLDGLKKSIPYIVVDSGRGIPPQLSSETKFLPFSLLQDFLLGPLVAKIGLVKAIMPLTRRK